MTMQQSDLLNEATLLTLSGASLAVTLIGNVANYVFSWNPKWFGLAVALALSFAAALFVGTNDWFGWIVAIIQGAQIFATAVGISAISGREHKRKFDKGSVKKVFWSSWI
jgi:hypothetical protein